MTATGTRVSAQPRVKSHSWSGKGALGVPDTDTPWVVRRQRLGHASLAARTYDDTAGGRHVWQPRTAPPFLSCVLLGEVATMSVPGLEVLPAAVLRVRACQCLQAPRAARRRRWADDARAAGAAHRAGGRSRGRSANRSVRLCSQGTCDSACPERVLGSRTAFAQALTHAMNCRRLKGTPRLRSAERC